MNSIGFIDQSVIMETLKIEFVLSSLTKEGISPLWYPFPVTGQAKRGRGDFMDNMCLHVWTS